MKEDKELVLLREFFAEWCKHEDNVEKEANCKTWDEAKHLYPLLDAYWRKADKLRSKITKLQATISKVRGKKTTKSSSSQRNK